MKKYHIYIPNHLAISVTGYIDTGGIDSNNTQTIIRNSEKEIVAIVPNSSVIVVIDEIEFLP